MPDLETRELTPAFGAEIIGFNAHEPFDEATRQVLQARFDDRGLLLFRDLELTHAEQVRLCKMLIRKEELEDGAAGAEIEDNFYISNKRPDSAVPFGRLQFHS